MRAPSATTNIRWGRITRWASRGTTSTCARPRSTAARTRSSAASSPKRCWVSEMDFSFSEEQTLLRDTVAKFLAANYDFETFKKVSRAEPGWRPETWEPFAELGLRGASLPEEFGGLGGGALETMLVMEEFGRALVVEPFHDEHRSEEHTSELQSHSFI